IVEEIDARRAVAVERSVAAAGRGLRREQPVRLDVEPVPLRDVADAGHMAGVVHPLQPLVAGPSGPDARLCRPLHRAIEVESPGIAVRVEVQRAERNLDLERPALFGASRTGVPDAVPLAVLSVDAEV